MISYFQLNVYHPFSGEPARSHDNSRSGQIQTRSALALSVQSVAINISRVRSILNDENKQFLTNVQFSIIAQISKAQFEYDIRRLSEMLTFPKIWYNRTLIHRLFFGDERLSSKIPASNKTTIHQSTPSPSISATSKLLRNQAHILLAIQLQELDILMRMSHVMGIVEWKMNHISSTGSIALTNEGKRTLSVSLGLQNSVFQAEQGIIGGMIRLKNLRIKGMSNYYTVT